MVRERSAAYAQAAERGRPATVPVRPPGERRRRGWLLPAALAALAGVIVAIVLLGGGGGGGGSGDKVAQRKPAPEAGRSPDKKSPAEPATPSGTPPATPSEPPPATPTGTPTAALTDFYTRAAGDDFEGSWALGTANLHTQFGGSIDTFRSTLATLQSITFPSLDVTSQSGESATVSFSTVAQHTDRTDHCSGQARLVAQGSRWLVDHIDVNCASGGEATKPKDEKKPKKPKKQK
jgi:hypothetical protein